MIEENTLIELDNTIYSKMADYDFLLPDATDGFKKFLRHFLYVVIDFLNQRDKKSLFIRIPVQELANLNKKGNSKLQEKRYDQITHALSSCLELFTTTAQLNHTLINSPTTYPGNWYNNDEYYLCISEDGNKDYILNSHAKNGKTILSFYKPKKPNLQDFRIFEKDKILGNSLIYKLSCTQMPGQVGATIDKCRKIIDSIITKSALCKKKNFIGYNSITYSGLASYNAADNYYIPSFVKRCGGNWNELIDNWSSELLVMMGDSNYLKNAQSIRNRLGNGELNKVLFIGTEKPWDDIETYDFSIQEMNRYCSHNGGQFHQIKYKELGFPWLTETMESLKELLSKNDNIDSTLKRLHGFLLNIFSDARFSSEFLKEYQRPDNEYINDTFIDILQNVDNDIYEGFIEWFRKLAFEETNPKKQYCLNEINNLCIYRSSYKRNVTALEGVNNKIFVDIPVYWDGDDNVIQYTMKNHLFADITVLYYPIEEKIRQKLESFVQCTEKVVYSALRVELGTGILSNAEFQPNNDNLIDYYSPEFYENIYISPNDSDHTLYTINFKDGRSVDLSGDILTIQDGIYTQKTIPALFNVNNQGIEIAYYLTPENFSDLVRTYADFPPNRNTEFFSALWKTKFYEYVQNQINESCTKETVLNKISKEAGININRLRLYATNGGGRFMHPREMKFMVDFMLSKNLLNQEDAQYVLAARNFTSTFNNSFGRRLKKGLLLYLTTGTISKDLQDILDKCKISIDDLKTHCINQGVIESIQTKNQ